MKNVQKLTIIANDTVMIVLALFSGYLLILTEATTLSSVEKEYFRTVDLTIAYIFLFEFLITLYFSTERRKFLKSRWWELLATIPFTSSATQALRLLRLLRIFRLGAHIHTIREDLRRK